VSCETEGCDESVKSIVAYGTFSTVPSQRANLCFRTHIKLVCTFGSVGTTNVYLNPG
jgi:hypothetical protein